ncbi:MopE-related protein [Patescibacteria group bacterium]
MPNTDTEVSTSIPTLHKVGILFMMLSALGIAIAAIMGLPGLIDLDEETPPIIKQTIVTSQPHPRLFGAAERMNRWRLDACRETDGSVTPNCTTTNDWNTFSSQLNKTGAAGYAVAYYLTKDENYANEAYLEADDIAKDYGGADIKTLVSPDERADNFLTSRDQVIHIATVYDFMNDHPSMDDPFPHDPSKTRRIWYEDYMKQLPQEIWNGNNVCFSHPEWSNDNPKNNFYYAKLLTTAYAAVVLDGEADNSFSYIDCAATTGQSDTLSLPMADGTIHTELRSFVQAKLEEQGIPTVMQYEQPGGGWHEGSNYSEESKMFMFEIFLHFQGVNYADYFNWPGFTFPSESVAYHLYTIQPGSKVILPVGDISRDTSMSISPYSRRNFLLLAEGLNSISPTESSYARYWTNNINANDYTWGNILAYRFLLNDPGAPQNDPHEALPTGFLSDGNDFVNSRSSWSDDAVSVSFSSPDRTEGHQHSDINMFWIYKGGPGLNGWKVTLEGFSRGLPRHTKYHNTVQIDDAWQRRGDGTGDIVRFQQTNEYTYAVGDASDAFYTNVNDSHAGDEKMTETYERELLHILPGYVVVYDRFKTTLNFTSSAVQNYFHYRGGTNISPIPPADLGNGVFQHTSDNETVYQSALLPTNGINTIISDEDLGDPASLYECIRVSCPPDDGSCTCAERYTTFRITEVDPSPDTPGDYRFLNVFQVGEVGMSHTPISSIISTTNNLEGTLIEDLVNNYLTMFTRSVDSVTQSVYTLPTGVNGESTKNILTNLLPSTNYTVTGAGVNTVIATSDQGVLEFTTTTDGQVSIQSSGGPICTDIDQDGYGINDGVCSAPYDCNDNNKLIHPGAIEICDNEDNNCDGNVDEGLQCSAALDEDFEGYSVGVDPPLWMSTGENNSTIEVPGLFTVNLDGSNKVLTCSPDLTDIHTHYSDPLAANWTNYKYTGKIKFGNVSSGAGITFFSDYPNSDMYYRIGRDDANRNFHLTKHPDNQSGDLAGTLDTGELTLRDTWYNFEIIAIIDIGSNLTTIKAKVWPEYLGKPAQWQIVATDSTVRRLTSGTVGIWSTSGTNTIMHDNIAVTEYDYKDYLDACMADYNDDEQITLIDLNKIAQQRVQGTCHETRCMDFNGDNKIDIVDISIFARYWPPHPLPFPSAQAMEDWCEAREPLVNDKNKSYARPRYRTDD